MDALNIGAFGFGMVIGWFLYFINRYRKADIQLSDITTLLTAIGGTAVLALFPSGTQLFGWYGIGLAIGFFTYFLVLVILVAKSPNFDADWFLDGRRKDPAAGYSIPGEARQTVSAMALPPSESGSGFHGTNPGGGGIQNFYLGRDIPTPVLPRQEDTAVQRAAASAISQAKCQAIVFAETATIEASDAELPGLAEARRFVAAVAYARNGNGVAAPRYPTADELKLPFVQRAWDRCGVAAADAKTDTVGKCRHFVIWYSDDSGKTPSRLPNEITDKWPYDHADKITKSWGPYKVNELGGSNIYVFKYCGVP